MIEFTYHLPGEYTLLYGFVNKSEREILCYSSYQGLRLLPASCALSFALRFSTKSVLNCSFRIMLEPGTRVSHHAVALAARAGTLLVWVGEAILENADVAVLFRELKKVKRAVSNIEKTLFRYDE